MACSTNYVRSHHKHAIDHCDRAAVNLRFSAFLTSWSQPNRKQRGNSRQNASMTAWFIRENSTWRRTETAPNFAPVAVELTAEGDCFLLVPPDASVTVNGNPVLNGIHLLRHKDEVAAIEGAIAYYTTDGLSEVVSFPGPAAKCGRCRSSILEGASAVKCACGVWYHQSDPPCFEYGDEPVCVACRRPTRLDGSGLWSPEEAE